MKLDGIKATTIIVLIMIISLFSACSSNGNDDIPVEIPEEEIEIAEDPEESKTQLIRVTGNKHDGPYLEYGAKTESGYYELLKWPNELNKEASLVRTGNIIYTDYATAQRIILCNVPGCAHNSDACTGYLSYSGFCVLFTNYSETKLYALSGGDYDVSYNDESELPSIIQMDMDGSNRKELVRLASDEYFSLNSAIIASDDYLYTCISKMGEINGKIKPIKSLVQISLLDGSIRYLMELNEMWDVLTSVWEDKELIISHMDTSTDESYLWRVSTEGEVLEEFGPYKQETLYYSSEQILTAETDSSVCIINRYDLKNGENTGHVEMSISPPSGGVFCNQYENEIAHLMFAVLEGNEFITKEYLIDFNTSEYREMELDYKENGVTKKVGAVSSTEDAYLVIHGVEQRYVSIVDKDGIPHKYEYPVYQTALILKDDYWNNRPVYQNIDDKVAVG